MSKTKTTEYNKLVRDKIPEKIKNNGETPKIRILENKEYKNELLKKLLEECNEVINADEVSIIEECADVLEVLLAISKLYDCDLEKLLEFKTIKKNKNGAFENKIFLESVSK